MTPSDLLEIIQNDIKAEKAKGARGISIEALEAYLGDLEKAIKAGRNTYDALALYRSNLERWRILHESFLRERSDFNRFAVDTGQNAIRGAMLINGGASVAMLAFIGNAWGNVPGEAMGSMTTALAKFAAGVLAAAIGGGVSYIAQRALLETVEPFDEESRGKGRAKRFRCVGFGFTGVAAIAITLAYVCFALGTSEAVTGFTGPADSVDGATPVIELIETTAPN